MLRTVARRTHLIVAHTDRRPRGSRRKCHPWVALGLWVSGWVSVGCNCVFALLLDRPGVYRDRGESSRPALELPPLPTDYDILRACIRRSEQTGCPSVDESVDYRSAPAGEAASQPRDSGNRHPPRDLDAANPLSSGTASRDTNLRKSSKQACLVVVVRVAGVRAVSPWSRAARAACPPSTVLCSPQWMATPVLASTST